MSRKELSSTSFDHDELKKSLVDFIKATGQFDDFDYEGSAINTIVDLLVHDSTYMAYLANMLANESFLDSAQIRQNVVSHAQKLSYTPKSSTASRLISNITIKPSNTPQENIIYGDSNTKFLASVGGETYTFTLTEPTSFSYNNQLEAFYSTDIELYQGQYLINNFIYNGNSIEIPNDNVDINTLKVFINDGTALKYEEATSITELGSTQNVYFLSENQNQRYEIKFGNNILGAEPSIGSIIRIEYINTEDTHANGVKSVISGNPIGGYSNISIDVTTPSYGGSDRDDIETIRFLAPKMYKAQDRALAVDDYKLIVLDQFPFITSVNVWGGEDNTPPRYGNVMISVIPENGLIVTDFLKRRIQDTLKKKAVGSVTPIVIEPVLFDISLDISFSFDRELTRKTFNELSAEIKETVNNYNLNELYRFNEYYNESQLISQLKQNSAIKSIIIEEELSIELNSNPFVQQYYNVNFRNEVEKNSFYVSNFVVNNNATNEKINDDGNGNIVYSWEENSENKQRTIGTIDYKEGSSSILIAFVQDNNFSFHVTPTKENIYTRENSALRINNIETKELVI